MVFFPSSTFPAFSLSVLQSCCKDCRAPQPRDPFWANGRAPNTEPSEASQSAQLMVGVEKGSPRLSFPFVSIPLCIPLFIFASLWPVTVSPKPTFVSLMKLYKAKVSQYTDRGSDNNRLAKRWSWETIKGYWLVKKLVREDTGLSMMRKAQGRPLSWSWGKETKTYPGNFEGGIK